MRLRRARPGDVPAVVAVLDDAAGWLRRRGVDQWPERFTEEWVAGGVMDGEVWLAVEAAAAVATYSLHWSDPLVWGDVGDQDDAGYVHQLAVRRDHAGGGLGARLLDHAGRRTHAAGRRWLRLDCVAHNAGLRAYYRRQGFVPCGEITGLPRTNPAWRSAARFQRLALSGVEC